MSIMDPEIYSLTKRVVELEAALRQARREGAEDFCKRAVRFARYCDLDGFAADLEALPLDAAEGDKK